MKPTCACACPPHHVPNLAECGPGARHGARPIRCVRGFSPLSMGLCCPASGSLGASWELMKALSVTLEGGYLFTYSVHLHQPLIECWALPGARDKR